MAPQARALLEGLRYNAAKEKGTAAAWRQFQRDHPEGSHRAEADPLIGGVGLSMQQVEHRVVPVRLFVIAGRQVDQILLGRDSGIDNAILNPARLGEACQ